MKSEEKLKYRDQALLTVRTMDVRNYFVILCSSELTSTPNNSSCQKWRACTSMHEQHGTPDAVSPVLRNSCPVRAQRKQLPCFICSHLRSWRLRGPHLGLKQRLDLESEYMLMLIGCERYSYIGQGLASMLLFVAYTSPRH